MQEDEVPPEHIWEDGEGLEQWWEHVKNRRKDGSDTKDQRYSSSSDDDEDEDDLDPRMAENDYARSLKRM